jgi:hypothetical protein
MEHNRNFGKLLLGVAVIAIGSLLLLDNLDVTYFPWREYLLSWKSIMIFGGLAILATQKNPTAGIILVSLGTIFWLPEMLNHQITINQVFWPSLLITIGLVVIFNTRKQRAVAGPEMPSEDEPQVTIIRDPESK